MAGNDQNVRNGPRPIGGVNPCGEVALPGSWFVQPWFQVQATQAMRARQGLPPLTADECDRLESELAAEIEKVEK